ncbi:MAG: hypothetical protein IPH65_13390 [Dehalococcoidia bacterium]|uniref:hypothetical protein n=1 Tax=Candidatus Amarobacter glycogenicus TaxID=3140699 RepID=UPI0031361968|nr:hypothetical protein [Dehalococcoidia bacterium]
MREKRPGRGARLPKQYSNALQRHTRMVEFLTTVTDGELAAHADYFGSLGEHHREHLAELESHA